MTIGAASNGHTALEKTSEVCIGGGASLEHMDWVALLAATIPVKLWIDNSFTV
eukprot:CAMPEP_0115607228 /NCGR_PEP_ID=MMETSP0272-20121206/18400_1 /TAXON_ID=71861 /ORGANISM="Scrippsiella trochoidea, Strain CCMP3099" /LENGTH=52 /DNA_ID=CAMNT_0003042905 /DNA_START=164 /DNA_END=322 /DNA_ORIENTATION=-